eukprot:350388-Chlamydomonas_euryale.AAC.11
MRWPWCCRLRAGAARCSNEASGETTNSGMRVAGRLEEGERCHGWTDGFRVPLCACMHAHGHGRAPVEGACHTHAQGVRTEDTVVGAGKTPSTQHNEAIRGTQASDAAPRRCCRLDLARRRRLCVRWHPSGATCSSTHLALPGLAPPPVPASRVSAASQPCTGSR